MSTDIAKTLKKLENPIVKCKATNYKAYFLQISCFNSLCFVRMAGDITYKRSLSLSISLCFIYNDVLSLF